MTDSDPLVTRELGDGAEAAFVWKDGLHAELRRLARAAMARERPDHTLQPTALVNEAWLRLVGQPARWESRAAFLRASARVMREILVDYARGRAALKRGERRPHLPLTDTVELAGLDPETLLAIDRALTRLASHDPRGRQVVELRYFAGLTLGESARVLNLSVKTVTRDWNFARAWLERELRT